MVCRIANVTNPAAATSISATTWPLLLLALIVVLGMAGGVGLVLSGAAYSSAAASQSLAGAPHLESCTPGQDWANRYILVRTSTYWYNTISAGILTTHGVEFMPSK